MSPSEILQVSEGGPAHQSGERIGATHQSGERVGAADQSEECIGAPHQPETEIKASNEHDLHNGKVSHQQARPVEEADTDPAIDHFSELPAELIWAVASHLNLSDKIQLRAVLSKDHQTFVDDILKSDMKRVYVSPTTRSLRTFRKICKSAYFQQFIQEVFFVAQAWGDVDNRIDLDAVKTGCDALRKEDASVERNIDFYSRHEGPVEPEIVTTIEELRPQVYIGGPHDMQWIDPETHQQAVEELRQGMSRLTRLESVVMGQEISGPGLNDCWLSHGRQWFKSHWHRRPIFSDKNSQLFYDCFAQRICSSTIEGTSAFLEAVAGLDKKPSSIGIGTSEHNDSLPFFLHPKLEAPVEALDVIGPNLASISGKPVMSERAKNLEVLSISNIFWPLKESYAHQSGDACKRAVDIILEHGNFPKLRELTLTGKVGPLSDFLDAEKLLPFLRRHRSTLQSVSLDRLCLLARSKLPEIAPVMESSLRTIRAEMGQQLVKFQLNIVSRTHNGKGRCLGSEIGEDGVRQCHRTCQEYDFECFWVDRAVFEALAGQMGAVLTEDGDGEEVWQFGEYVLRR
ncbi:unnamed protein product [Cercospora beticola]|nr:unnamed protein product [Cercospora beticola]